MADSLPVAAGAAALRDWPEEGAPSNGDRFVELVRSLALTTLDPAQQLEQGSALVHLCCAEDDNALGGGVKRWADPAIIVNVRIAIAQLTRLFPLLTHFPQTPGTNWIVEVAKLEFRLANLATALPVIEDSFARLPADLRHLDDCLRFLVETIPNRHDHDGQTLSHACDQRYYARALLLNDAIGRNPHSGPLWHRWLKLARLTQNHDRAVLIAGQMLSRPLLFPEQSTLELYTAIYSEVLANATAEQLLRSGIVTREEMATTRNDMEEANRDNVDEQARRVVWSRANHYAPYDAWLGYHERGFNVGWSPAAVDPDAMTRWDTYCDAVPTNTPLGLDYQRMLHQRSLLMFDDQPKYWIRYVNWIQDATHHQDPGQNERMRTTELLGVFDDARSSASSQVCKEMQMTLALWLESRDDVDTAVEVYETLLSQDPTDMAILRALVRCHGRGEDGTGSTDAQNGRDSHAGWAAALEYLTKHITANFQAQGKSTVSQRAEAIRLLAEVHVLTGADAPTARAAFDTFGADLGGSAELVESKLQFDLELVRRERDEHAHQQHLRETFAKAQTELAHNDLRPVVKVYLEFLTSYGTHADAREIYNLSRRFSSFL